ncbi:MAG TPA: large-conductance mechanosensitive channel protein MscL [Ignavibacteriales bacterium]|nr:large-conductance mechanosensitive channel protein MscL [Ignavibacteriales bacterium]
MSLLKEFRDFANRGNLIDLAVAVVIGGAFGKIINSIVADIIMPPIGLLLGGVDFSNLKLILKDSPIPAEVVSINYGLFINTIVDFLIIAFSIFIILRYIKKFQKQEAAAAPTTKKCPECAIAIPIEAKRCGYCNTVLVK